MAMCQSIYPIHSLAAAIVAALLMRLSPLPCHAEDEVRTGSVMGGVKLIATSQATFDTRKVESLQFVLGYQVNDRMKLIAEFETTDVDVIDGGIGSGRDLIVLGAAVRF